MIWEVSRCSEDLPRRRARPPRGRLAPRRLPVPLLLGATRRLRWRPGLLGRAGLGYSTALADTSCSMSLRRRSSLLAGGCSCGV